MISCSINEATCHENLGQGHVLIMTQLRDFPGAGEDAAGHRAGAGGADPGVAGHGPLGLLVGIRGVGGIGVLFGCGGQNDLPGPSISSKRTPMVAPSHPVPWLFRSF